MDARIGANHREALDRFDETDRRFERLDGEDHAITEALGRIEAR